MPCAAEPSAGAGSLDPMDQQPHRNAFPEDAVPWLLATSPPTVAVLGDVGLAAACAALGPAVTDTQASPRAQSLPLTDRSVSAAVALPPTPPHFAAAARASP